MSRHRSKARSKKKGNKRSKVGKLKRYSRKGGSRNQKKQSKKVGSCCEGRWKSWRGWNSNKKKPKSIQDRKEMKQKCGAKCFGDPSQLKYPWCSKGSCTLNRAALLNAKIMSQYHGNPKVAQKAKRLMEKPPCKTS